jgi:beta-glucuronidase
MGRQPDADIMQNGIEQLGEMVARDRNHPCIGSWGLCNEIDGQNAPAYHFATNMLAEAKRLDPNRLCSYASHSLFKTPQNDVSGLMDFVSCNEYFGSWQPGGPADLSQMIDQVHASFPDKPIVISEYGYCACTAERPEGDGHRQYILRSQDEVFRQRDYIAGLIFFCYNDYRTHVGDRGSGVLQQRVHGVVDLFGARKDSYALLRAESSPVESLTVKGSSKDFEILIRARAHLPGYTLQGYKLRGVFYGYGDIPLEQKESPLPDLVPGASTTVHFSFADALPLRIEFEVLRPTGFSAFSQSWRT